MITGGGNSKQRTGGTRTEGEGEGGESTHNREKRRPCEGPFFPFSAGGKGGERERGIKGNGKKTAKEKGKREIAVLTKKAQQ